MVKEEVKKRKYLQSHPWINFQLNMKAFDYKIWMLLGEAQSKCEHIAGVPLKPETAKELNRIALIKGAAATTAIEGNTLTEEEVRDYMDHKLQLPPSKEYLGIEIRNIRNEFDFILENIENGKFEKIDIEDINRYNFETLKNLNVEVEPGKIRSHPVVVGNVYRGAPAEDCKYLLERMCDWLNDKSFTLGDEYRIASGLLKALVAHIYIAWIHPYGDGNGRTARLLEYRILLESGVPSPAAHLLSNHYNQTRSEYYRQLALSSKTSDIIPFIKYALQGFVDGLVSQLRTIRNQTLDLTWINYIHECFKNKSGAAQERRRHLALDISKLSEPVPMVKLKYVSPHIAELYARKNLKIIYNDVKELVSMNLLVVQDGLIRANKETILAFLPFLKKS